VRDTPTLIELLEAGLDLIELPGFRFDKRGDGFGGEKRPGSARPPGKGVETLLGAGVDTNGQDSRHLSSNVYKLPQTTHEHPSRAAI
jgi:hypothetical protein